MPKLKVSNKIKKNLLDNDFNKYLQYFNTCIILLFTYIIGVAIVFITKQINYRDFGQMGALSIVSIVVISILTSLIFQFRKQLKKVRKEIEVLKIG